MIKRTLTLFLALCLLFAACGKDKTDNTNDPTPNTPTISDRFASNEDAAAIIELSINPSFEIYLLSEGVVSGVKATNQDAQVVLGGQLFDGMPLNECIQQLLQKAQDNNFLKADSKVDIQVYVKQGSQLSLDPTKTVSDAIEKYKSDNNTAFFYNVQSESVAVQNNQGGQNDIDESQYQLVERDSNGNLVKTVQQTPAYQGTPAQTVTCYYGSDGSITKQIRQDTNVTLTIEYVNGVKTKEVCEEGTTRYETVYNEKGLPVKETGSNAEYSYQVTFTTSGSRDTETQNHKDGRVSVISFYPDNTRKSVDNKMTDGTRSITTFYQGGGMQSSHEFGPNGDNKYYYDASGNKTRYEGKDNRGNPVTGTYNSDGTATFKTTMPDGSVVTTHTDANGNVINQE